MDGTEKDTKAGNQRVKQRLFNRATITQRLSANAADMCFCLHEAVKYVFAGVLWCFSSSVCGTYTVIDGVDP